MKINKVVFKIILTRLTAAIAGSLMISLWSFFLPFKNLSDYTFHDILYYESDYWWNTFIVFVSLSILTSLILLLCDFLLLRIIEKTVSQKFRKFTFLLTGELLIILPFIIIPLLGYHLRDIHFKYTLPVFIATYALSGIILLKEKYF